MKHTPRSLATLPLSSSFFALSSLSGARFTLVRVLSRPSRYAAEPIV